MLVMSLCQGGKNHPGGGGAMRRQHPHECGICGRGTPTLSGTIKVWQYEPHADFYCAQHWEEAFEQDRLENCDNLHWEMVTEPILELTRHAMRNEAQPLVAV
jgi:hypothetical protein